MAIQIKFDEVHNPIEPTIVLAARNGRKLGKLCVQNIVLKASMSGDEVSFKADKTECGNLWEQITDFKLVWIREWNKWFEIYVETGDTDRTEKSVTAVSLGKAELSQINLYDKEINTETDISRDDYKPTVFYSADKSASLLDRIIEKAPHYSVGHVDSSLRNIQRTFSFNEKNIYDALTEISEEIECLIDIECSADANGSLTRKINVYDLKQVCVECGKRGDFVDTCSECGSHNILPGYGNDTTIYVSTENLAENINYSTDTGSVKNCFKLEAGDDLMTATIVGCNPNGSGYIWYISDETKKDMSQELVAKLARYDKDYTYYMKDHVVYVPENILNRYNSLIDKYRAYTSSYRHAVKEIVGYPALMERYFDTIDFGLYLSDKLMPDIKMSETNAQEQINKIITYLTEPVAVKDLENCSSATVDSAVLGVAKAVCNTRYKIRITESSFNNNIWNGVIEATNEADESDTYTSPKFACIINDKYEDYVKQKILKSMKKTFDDAVSLQNMFALTDEQFSSELVKYCLSRLSAFHDACQTCVDILIEQGVADPNKWKYREDDMYNGVYLPYYNKLKLIEAEMKLRESEIAVVCGNENETGMQTILGASKDSIQSILNFETYLSSNLYKELSSYRREDTYKNTNYISDGLDNAELFQMAMSFLEIAKSDIIKSSTLQHKIDAKLKNLLAMQEFYPIVDHFEVGNWMRIRVDGRLCKLRLVGYEIDFDNFGDISVDFSDVVSSGDTVSDVESVISQASSIASSYDVVARQAKKGEKSNSEMSDWVNRGLSLTKLKIIDSADNQNISWDSHGLLCKEYLPTLGSYDDRQLKIINRGLYLTDDGWKSSKAGIGDFTYWNPKTGKMEESYGIIADAIVGNIVLTEEVGIYNQNNSMSMSKDGLQITAFKENGKISTIFNIRKKVIDADGNESYQDELYLDDDGNLVINGTVRINSTNASSAGTIDDIGKNVDEIKDRIDGFNGLHLYIRYAKDKDGSDMKDTPDIDTEYIGICNTDNKTAPTDPKEYTWSKMKGEQGIPGIQGVDGKSSYLFIRYSNDGKTFTENNGTELGDWIGTCISESSDAPVDFHAYTWKRFSGIDGLNTAYILLYRRCDTVPTVPNGTVKYWFQSGEIVGDISEWSRNIPETNGMPCYVTHAMASSREEFDEIAPNEWSKPEKMVEDGRNTATVFLYKRSVSKAAVDWKSDLIYSFKTESLNKVPDGWSNTLPDGTDPIYVTAATASSNTDTDTIGYQEWSSPVVLAQNGTNGVDGKDGVNGLNTASVVLYKRSETVPERPNQNVTYTFTTGTVTGADAWSIGIPSGSEPCYVIHATACSDGATDTISPSEWSDPVVFVVNGQKGDKGEDGASGKDGTNGANGYNTAVVYLYRRSSTALKVDWTSMLTYTFSTKKISTVPTGWSQTIPSGTNPIYVTTACAYSNTDTDTIGYQEWSSPVVLAQNGTDGVDGKDGVNGTSSYFYIRYSDYSNGSDFYVTPKSSTLYIGVCSSTSPTAPAGKESYTWSRFKGYNGAQGPAGADGKSQYVHIKYSDDGESFTENNGELVGAYIGIRIDSVESDSAEFDDYTWNRITGDVDGIINGMLAEIQKHDDEYNEKFKTINTQYKDVMESVDHVFESYRSEIGQYMAFGDDGLTLGAKTTNSGDSKFKTTIDNKGIYFKENDAVVSFIQNRSLYIGNAVIESTMKLGNFFFAPRYDEGSEGSVSIIWEDMI